ncbi:MAG: ATP-binding protein [Burkholderiaceae bacterium]
MVHRHPTATGSNPRPWWVALALWLALSAGAAAAMWHVRRIELADEARTLEVLTLALADEVERSLQSAETGLRGLRGELVSGRLPAEGGRGHPALQARAVLMPALSAVWVLDGRGQVTVSSDVSPPPELGSFLPLPDGLDDHTIAVSTRFLVPGSNQALVALALRLRERGADEPLWVVGALPASTLLGAFVAAMPAGDARMGVYRQDGTLLAATPRGTAAAGAASAGEAAPAADIGQSLVRHQDLARFGLRVELSRNREALLKGWRETAGLVALGCGLLLAAIAGAVLAIQRADRRHARALQALQTQRARQSKLESLGTLAGSVAHDFNNVLAAVVGFGEMAQDAAPAGSAQARHLDKLMQAAMRGKALVERILAFSRGGARASVAFELQAVVQEALALIAGSLPAGVRIEPRLEAPGASLQGDPTQVFEAVMNLCTNAWQAMPAGGAIEVGLRHHRAATEQVLSHSRLAPGRYLALRVADQGAGIGADTIEHLFEPFFTTRGKAGGTGLGLAVVHGVVAEFGGAIDVAGAPGQGAAFTLYFPASEATAAPRPAQDRPARRGEGQPVLVLDDDPALVAMGCELLRGLGYAPTGFDDPQRALNALRDTPDGFAAVLTDEVMPGMNGTQFAQAARALVPGLPVLLISGYGGAMLAQRAAQAGVQGVLGKPLRRADLARALETLLA